MKNCASSSMRGRRGVVFACALVLALCPLVGASDDQLALAGSAKTVRGGVKGFVGVQPGVRTTGLGTQRVAVLLTGAGAKQLPMNYRAALAGRIGGQRASRLLAQGSPKKLGKRELAFAGAVERARRVAFVRARGPARAGVAQQEAVARQIARLGGTIEPAMPSAGTIIAVVPSSRVIAISRLAGVRAVVAAKKPVPLNSASDGSQTWHNAGYMGQTPNAANSSSDGPDVVVYDSGITTSHQAFNSRLGSDCSTCAGTGLSKDPAHPAAGPNTRIFSPAGRVSFGGSKHGNAIAATIAATDFTSNGSGSGLSYGIDELYDVAGAKSPINWALGNTYQGEPGITDAAEVMNYSQGTYEDTIGFNPIWSVSDRVVDEYGINHVIAAGNCGIQDSFYTNCFDGPHRVATPGNLFNVLTVGGTSSCASSPSTICVWANSSSGPTWDGRKKPDLVSSPYPGAGAPKTYDDDNNGKLDDYGGAGIGTSFAAPKSAAGAALLASVGVGSPIAQRAILINSATPIQNQTYWTPTSGWGEQNLDAAFHQRGNYAQAQVTGSGANGARFFQITGAAVGDRATLAWNRRQHVVIGTGYLYRDLTNLDLTQISPTDSTGATVTSTGGSDAADTVDSNTVDSNTDPGTNAPTDNPMPGSGQDAGDNIEQVRSTATGTQILRVKALSDVDGQAAEPFALASKNPITALQSPIPQVALSSSSALVGAGEDVTLTASVTNPSNTLTLAGAAVALDALPSGVSVIGASSANLGAILPGATASTTFTVEGTTGGLKSLAATASGTTYGEPFAGSGSAEVAVDTSAPALSVDSLPTYSQTAAPAVSWSATDDFAPSVLFDAEQQVGGGAWTRVVDNQSTASLALAAPEGSLVALRVRARDSIGNESAWQEVSTTIDVAPAEISFGAAQAPTRGAVSVPVTASNAGAPISSSSYVFAVSGSTPARPLAGAALFQNTGTAALTPKLTVTVVDAIGRSVTKSQTYSVAPRWLLGNLRILRAKGSRGKLAVSGSVASEYSGVITITAQRRGKTGTKSRSKKVRARAGRYSATLRLAAGKYRVRASLGTSGDFLASSAATSVSLR